MSADSAWDVQVGVYARLAATPNLTDRLARGVGSLLDPAPADAPFPYLTFGALRVQPLEGRADEGSDINLTLHAYSRSTSGKELKDILSAVRGALHDAVFEIPNQTLVLCQLIDVTLDLDADGITRQGALRFRIVTEPAEEIAP